MLPKLNVIIGADTDQLDRKLTKTQVKLRKFAKVAGVAVAAAAVAMGAMVKAGLRNIDAQAKLAQSLGTTVASIQVLERAGELAGVSMQGIEQATKDLTRRLSQAATGTGPAVDALKRLRLEASTLSEMPLDKRIETINDAISEFIPLAEQAAVAGQLFGEEGSIAMSRIDGGTIRQAAQDMREFGVIISEVDAEQIERTNDALSRVTLILKGVVTRLTVGLAPALEWLAGALAELWKDIRVVAVTFSYMGDIFSEAAQKIGLKAEAMGQKFKASTLRMKAVWQDFIKSIATKWGEFVTALAPSINRMSAAVQSEFRLSNIAALTFASGMENAASNSRLLANEAEGMGKTISSLADQPLLSVRAMLMEVNRLGKSMGLTETDTNNLNAALSNLGGDGSVKTALENVKSQIESIADSIGNTLGAGLMDMVSGTKTVAQAFKSMAVDVIKELYRILVVEQLVAAFKSLITGGGSVGSGAVTSGVTSAPVMRSFAGGGYTGDGTRSGGIDGKGGSLAIVHPRETIVDHTKVGANNDSVIVNQTINVDAGVSQTVRAEMNSMLPEFQQQTIQAVTDAKRRSSGGF